MKQATLLRTTLPFLFSLFVLRPVFGGNILPQDAPDGWKVELSVGGVSTSGNTETSTLQGKVDARKKQERWESQYVFSGLDKKEQVIDDQGDKRRQTSAQKYFGSLKSSYLLDEKKSYVFGYASYANDKFGAYRTYGTVSAGYGDWLISTPDMKWFAEAGPGYFTGKKPVDGFPGMYDKESGALLHLASELTWEINEHTEFKQSLSVESSADNTRTIGEVSLAASITDAMKMKVGINVAHDSKVPADKLKTDTTTFVNLVYSL